MSAPDSIALLQASSSAVVGAKRSASSSRVKVCGLLGLERGAQRPLEGEELLGGAGALLEQALDPLQVEALGLKLLDQPQPGDVLGAVVADAVADLGGGEQAAGAVRADVAHRHPRLGGELLDRERVLARCGPSCPVASRSCVPIVCTLSLSAVSASNVTSNDVTLFTDTGTYGNYARINEERDDEHRTTTAPPRSPRRLGQRLLGSGLLDLLAGPPGVDGYLEQIQPDLGGRATAAPRSPRCERLTPDSVTLEPARQPRLGGLPGRPVHPARRRDRRRAAHPLLLAGLGRRHRPRARADGQGAPRGPRLQLPDRARARPGMVARARARPTATSRLPDERPERILLISGGSGITPVMSMLRTLCAEGHTGPGHLPALRPRRRARDLPRRARADRAAHPNVRLVRSYTRAAGTGELDGHFDLTHLGRLEPSSTRAETFACGPPALLDAVRETWAERGARGAPPRRELRPADAGAGRAASPRAQSTSPAPTSGSRTAAPRCSSRPRPPGSARSSAAGWASATPAPAARRRAR